MASSPPCRKEASDVPTRYKFDYLFLKRFGHLIPILFVSWKSVQTILFFLLLIVAGGETAAAYYVGLIPSHFYIVLPARDWSGFMKTLWESLLYILLIALIISAKNYISMLLYVKWRETLTTHIHKLYFRGINYYKLNVLQTGNIDNTDQRIAQDVDKLCNKLYQVVPILIISPFTIAVYTYFTYSITGYLGPLVVYGYFIIGTIIIKFIMSPVVNLTYQREMHEGIFRFQHVKLRSHSESVAAYSAGRVENDNTNVKLSNLLDVQLSLTNWEFWLKFAVNLFNYTGSILSYIIISIPIFAGIYSDLPSEEIPSLISAYSFQTLYLINCFSNIIDISSKVSDAAGYTHRIAELLETLEKLSPSKKPSGSSHAESGRNISNSLQDFTIAGGESRALVSEYERDREYLSDDPKSEVGLEENSGVDDQVGISLKELTVTTPATSHVLIKHLSLEITEGRSVLVTGMSGTGKTSLLRSLHGLWPFTHGSVERRGVDLSDIMYLPQKSYLTDGTLEDQILYPSKFRPCQNRPGPDKNRLEEILDQVGLQSLLQRCGGLTEPVSWSWDDILTPGQAQSLAFARLLYHRPKFAFLDEVTSALPAEMEVKLYALCQEAKMTLVSIGHQSTLRQFHDVELSLDGKGGWTLEDIPHEE